MEASLAPSAAPCSQCDGRSYLIESEKQKNVARVVARVCDCSRVCRRCEGRGHVLVTQEETFSKKVGPKRYEVLALCSCQLLNRRIDVLRQADIPAVAHRATFEGFQPQNPAQNHAKEIAQAFALGFRRNQPNKGFVLSGPVGTGKTHLLAAALVHLVMEQGFEAKYVEISLLYSEIRRGFQEGKSGGEIIGPLAEKEVLAIDELGKGRGSQFELETMDELIARRYNAGRTTLFATNFSLEYARKPGAAVRGYVSTPDAKEQAKESLLLRERVGERIYSRLCEMCDFVEFQAPDHRHMRHDVERPARSPLQRHTR